MNHFDTVRPPLSLPWFEDAGKLLGSDLDLDRFMYAGDFDLDRLIYVGDTDLGLLIPGGGCLVNIGATSTIVSSSRLNGFNASASFLLYFSI